MNPFNLETYARDLVEINGQWYIVDTVKAWDTHKWETGLTKIDTEAMYIFLAGEADEGDNYKLTSEDIEDYAESFTTDWYVEQHANYRTAVKRHKEICKTAILYE